MSAPFTAALPVADVTADEFWAAACARFEKALTREQYQVWIKPLELSRFDRISGRLVLSAPNRAKADHFRGEYLGLLGRWAHDHFGQDVDVSLEVASTSSAVVEAPAQSLVRAVSADLDNPFSPTVAPGMNGGLAVISLPMVSTESLEKSKVNPALRFENFVTGKANQMARAAALQVADNPGVSYNPLFLYGGTGLGKTHLIHSIGNQMLENKSDAKVRYIHAETYVGDVVRAYQRKDFDAFKRYYHSLDLLLIDDIQFFAGKERTQEEFFYLFEALLSAKSQIIITSDTYPKELADIDDRLKSRFDAGLTVAIEPPELEMRVAILLRKAEELNRAFDSEVAFFVAKHLRSNVRELEGALRKIIAYADFHAKLITLDVAKDALRDLLQVSRGQISIEVIQKTVADYYKIKVADMYSKRRPANIAMPRQVAMYLAKELTQKSLPEIGELFGGRDHTTVLHAVRKIGQERNKDSQLNHTLHVLEQTLKN
jgi:chromosomal replication initiator protein